MLSRYWGLIWKWSRERSRTKGSQVNKGVGLTGNRLRMASGLVEASDL